MRRNPVPLDFPRDNPQLIEDVFFTDGTTPILRAVRCFTSTLQPESNSLRASTDIGYNNQCYYKTRDYIHWLMNTVVKGRIASSFIKTRKRRQRPRRKAAFTVTI